MSSLPSTKGVAAPPAAPAVPVVRAPGEGVVHHVARDDCRCILSAEVTGGAFSLFELVTPPGEGPPLHTHSNEDETFIILEGEVEVCVGDTTRRLTPGAVAFGPRGVRHAFRNVGTGPLRMYMIASPGGFERFFGECHERLPRTAAFDPALFVEIIRKHGMTVVDHP